MRAFAQAERFVSEVEKKKLRPAYVFVGDEVFFRKRFREAILEHLVPNDVRDFSLFDFDLAETDVVQGFQSSWSVHAEWLAYSVKLDAGRQTHGERKRIA